MICTRNRADSVARTLSVLSRQQVDAGFEWQILVVDNAPGDASCQRVVQTAAEGASAEVQYVLEPELGLARARNTGWRKARGDVIAYIDDDTLPAEHWLRELLLPYNGSNVAAVCGRLIPRPDTDNPNSNAEVWRQEYTFDLGDEVHDTSWLCGANMSFRREWLQRIEGFDTRLGRVGPCLLASDEHDASRAILRDPEKPRIVYTPRALAYHRTQTADLDDSRLIKRHRCAGVSTVLLDRKDRPLRWARELALRQFKQGLWLARALMRTLRRKPTPLLQRARFEEFVGYYRELFLGPERGCRGCPMQPYRRASLGTSARERR